jgi:hypothetical protein
MQEAVRDRVLNSQEAEAVTQYLSQSEQQGMRPVEVPESIWPAVERLRLWSAESPSLLRH